MLNIKAHDDSNTGHKNVFHRKDTGMYSVRMTLNSRYRTLGSYEDLDFAIAVANLGRTFYHGEYARNE